MSHTQDGMLAKMRTGIQAAVPIADDWGNIEDVTQLWLAVQLGTPSMASEQLMDLWEEYFDLLGISEGNYNDRAFEWLTSLGYTGSLSDMMNRYWCSYTGALIQRGTNPYFDEITLGAAVAISQLSATDPAVATFTLGANLWDSDASTFVGSSTYSWTAYGSNTIANVGNELQITYSDSETGAYVYLNSGEDLTEDLTVGQWYKFTFDAYYVGGSSGTRLRLYSSLGIQNSPLLTGVKTTYSLYFRPGHVNGGNIYLTGMDTGNVVYLDNLKVECFAEGLLEGDFMAFSGFGEVLAPDVARTWDIQSGSPSIAGDTITFADEVSSVRESAYWTTGKTYKINCTVANYSGSGDIALPYDGSGTSLLVSANGTYEYYYTPDDNVSAYIYSFAGHTCDVTVNFIQEVKPVDGTIYELGAFTNNTAPLKNYLGDFDLSDLAAATGSGNGHLATVDDYTTGDGVGPFRKIDEASELWDPDAAVFAGSSTYSWIDYANNTLANVANELEITFVDGVGGARVSLNDAADLSSDLTANQIYKLSVDAYYTGGAAGVKLLLYNPSGAVVNTYSPEFTLVKTTYTIYFKAGGATDVLLRLDDMATSNIVYIDNLSLKEVSEQSVQITGSQTSETNLLQDLGEAALDEFNVGFEVVDRQDGGIKPTAGGADGTEVLASGTYDESITALNAEDTGLKFSSACRCKVDNLLLKEFYYGNVVNLYNDQSTLEETNIKLALPATKQVVIDWGDGNFTTATEGYLVDYAHNYSSTGEYVIRLTGDLNDVYGFGLDAQSFISGELSTLASMPSLTYIHVGSTGFTGELCSICELTSLTEIRLYNIDLSGDISEIAGWTSAVNLQLYSTNVSGNLNSLVTMLSLTTLHIGTSSVIYTTATLPDWDAANITASSCGWTSAMVDAFLIDLDTASSASTKTVNLGGTNAARTSASDAAKTSLEGKGWTVTVNE